MFKLVFYVPVKNLHDVKSAVLSAGGGRFQGYRDCCWYTLGTGEFIPNEDASPAIGEIGELVSVAEYRVEILVSAEDLKPCIAALKLAHPYEQPAFEAIKLEVW